MHSYIGKNAHVDHATVSGRISSLESSLQNQLIDRNARACRLTDLGKDFLNYAKSMEETDFTIEHLALAANESIRGKVVVSAPPVLATHLLAKNRKIICEVSDITSQIMAVKSGVCIGALPCFIADYEPKIWLVVHADLRSSPLS